jgi:RNA polymerase sigma factor (sigma-70 family)
MPAAQIPHPQHILTQHKPTQHNPTQHNPTQQDLTQHGHSGTDVTELVRAARRRDPGAGNEAVWNELMRRYGSLVRSIVARYRLQEADAADAVQSTWCKAVEQLDALREPERLGAWLSTIAGRECLALIRRARRERPDDAVVDARLAPVGGPDAAVLAAEVTGVVGAAVAALAPRRRQLVHELFYLPERDYAQVSKSMGMPVGSIGPTRGRVLAGLRASLDRAGFGPRAGDLDCGPGLTA